MNDHQDSTQDNNMPDTNYEKMVHKLTFAAINEQRRARRWRIFFLFLFFAYMTPVLVMLMNLGGDDYAATNGGDEKQHSALVSLTGVIASDEEASADNVIAGLKAAFSNENTKGVILEINSPGGSPVQSSYIYNEIRRLREEHESIPLYVVVSDMAASGGYFVAAAADKIFVNKSSLVGSIGVRMDNFGFVELMKKVGVERRLLTAGENKGLLDPFLPEDLEQKAHLQQMLNEVHEHFIQAVKDGRGDRLKQSPGLFSGLIWTGEKAISLGLVDAIGSTRSVARDHVEAEKIVNFTPRGTLIDRLADRLGASISTSFWRLLATQLQ
jgi:protease-4